MILGGFVVFLCGYTKKNNKAVKNDKNYEIWRTVKGYEGYFLISNTGKLKVLQRQTLIGKKRKVSRILETYIKTSYYLVNNIAYYQVNLYGKRLIFNVSKLVATAFLPNPNGFKFVAFVNGNNQDFNVKNLFWSKKGGKAARLT